MKKTPSLIISLIPVAFLIFFLMINVRTVFGEDALMGPNQLILILSGGVAAALGVWYGVPFKKIVDGIGSFRENRMYKKREKEESEN